MTKREATDLDQPQSDGVVMIKRALLGMGGGIFMIFIAGIVAGYASVVIEHGGPSMIDTAILAGLVLAMLVTGYAMWRFWPGGKSDPVGPRVKAARNILAVLMLAGAFLGVVLGVAEESSGAFLSNAPVSAALATVSIAIWLIAVPVLTWMWWRRVDEHEAGAYRDGASVALHFYFFIAPSWWMAARAGWLPAQDPMVVLLIVSLAWSIVWFVKKYL